MSPLKATRPEELFSSKDQMRDEYLALVKKHHPDQGGDPKIMAQITMLYQAGQKLTKWVAPNRLEIKTTKGHVNFNYTSSITFEFGMAFFNKGLALYLLDYKYSSYLEIATATISNFQIFDEKLTKNMADKLPVIMSTFISEAKDHIGIVFRADPPTNWFPLKSVNIQRDQRHVAWILNRIYDTLCFLQLQNITHNNILMDSLIVNPKDHRVQLHGWWYAAPRNAPIHTLPRAAFAVLPPDMKSSKVADSRLDLALVKALGRELLGDRTGMTLIKSPIVQFLRSPTTGNAYDDFVLWEKVQAEQFGARKFIPLQEPT